MQAGQATGLWEKAPSPVAALGLMTSLTLGAVVGAHTCLFLLCCALPFPSLGCLPWIELWPAQVRSLLGTVLYWS